MKNKNIIEINSALTQSQRTRLVNEVASRGRICGPVVYRYLAGTTTPLYLYKKLICEVINEEFGIFTTVETLWPEA